MAKPYQERFQSMFKSGARACDVLAMTAETEGLIESARAAADAARQVALDPSSLDCDAAAARDQAEGHLFAVERLAAGLPPLLARHAELLNSEQAQALTREYQEVADRTALLKQRIADRVPALFAELVGLLEDIEANDAQVDAINRIRPGGSPVLVSAELAARGAGGNYWPPHNINPVERLTAMRLPRFDSWGHCWPIDYHAAAMRQSEEVQGRAMAAARAANTPEALAKKAKAAAERWQRYRLFQRPYAGKPIEGLRHRDGVGYVDHREMTVWMDERQVLAAKAKGVTVEPLPAPRKTLQLTG